MGIVASLAFFMPRMNLDDSEAINRLFAPEFRNRLDAIVPFAYLPTEVVSRVVDKFILQLEEQLADRNVTIELDAGARQWLSEKGYDRLFGARPLGRIIQEHVKKPLAEEILFGKLKEGGIVRVLVEQKALALMLHCKLQLRKILKICNLSLTNPPDSSTRSSKSWLWFMKVMSLHNFES